MIETKSILRYPGGKFGVRKQIYEYFKYFDTIISSFCGGCHCELYFANMGKKVICSDIDKNLINCWQQLCNNRDEMYDYAKYYYNFFHSNISKEEKREEYYRIRENAKQFLDIKGAAEYFITNRISFSGLGLKGGFSEDSIYKNLGYLILKRLEEWKKPEGFEIPVCMDFEELLNKYPTYSIFLDPPYYMLKGFLYVHHKDFNHERLAEVLKKRNTPWMMTYNDCPEIRSLYSSDDIRIEERSWTYSMAKGKRNEGKARQGNELFISKGIL